MPSLQARAERPDRAVPTLPLATRTLDQFEGIVRTYKRDVMLVAYRITNNIDDAHDVAQYVFMQMHLKRPDLSDRRSIERWLYIVTRNEALTVARRRLRDDDSGTLAPEELPKIDLEEIVMANERAARVRATIARLPAADRHVIELRHLQSMPTTEIAAHLGIPVKRVKHDVERAKARLRVEMRKYGLDREVV
jgi:RNA polymerase sigma-70 factor (ECF subfamily)